MDIDYPQTEDIGWEEEKHPRGQPKNQGQFAKGQGGGAGAPTAPPTGKQPGRGATPTQGQESAHGAPGKTVEAPAPAGQSSVAQPGKPASAPGKGAGGAAKPGEGAASSLLPEIPPELSPEEARAAGDLIAAQVGASELVAAARQKLAAKGSWTSKSSPAQGGFFDSYTNTWTPQREQEHQRILGSLFTNEAVERATPEPGKKPTMVVLGGRGGSGKSWLTGKDGPVDESKFIKIDSDAFKESLPEYEGWNAALLHDECDHLVERAQKYAQALGLNVVHDATVKSEAGVAGRVADYKKNGYDIEGHYMFCPPETACARALQRYAKKGERGRYVPPEVILGNRKNERNFDALTDQFSRWSVHDNSGDAPRFVAGSDDGAGTEAKAGAAKPGQVGAVSHGKDGISIDAGHGWFVRIADGRLDRRLSR